MMLMVDTSVTNRRCVKCRSRRATLRHHKGCDRYLGKFNPVIRRNYNRFLECVRLCDECHEEIHLLYLPLFRLFPHKTPKDAAIMRLRLIKICDLWLTRRTAIRSPLTAPHRARFSRFTRLSRARGR